MLFKKNFFNKSIISMRCLLGHYFTAGTSTTHRCLNPGTPEYRNTYKKTFFVTYL